MMDTCSAFFVLGCLFGVVLTLIMTYMTIHPISPYSHCEPHQDRIFVGNRECSKSTEAVNNFLQFLFQEVKDTGRVRRYFIRKIKAEMDELMKRKGVYERFGIIKNIKIRDFSLGTASPEFSNLSLKDVSLDAMGSLKTVEISAHISYSCGFSLAVSVETFLDKPAVFTLKMNRFESNAYLVFCREPFTHWYISFQHDPIVEVEVTSQFGVTNVPGIANLLAGLLKKALMRKHVWPLYKIRFRPFFPLPPRLKLRLEQFRTSAKLMVKQPTRTIAGITELDDVGDVTKVHVVIKTIDRLCNDVSDMGTANGNQFSIMALMSSGWREDLSGFACCEADQFILIRNVQTPPVTNEAVSFGEIADGHGFIVYVQRASSGSPAERLLQVGDIVFTLNEKLIVRADEIQPILDTSPATERLRWQVAKMPQLQEALKNKNFEDMGIDEFLKAYLNKARCHHLFSGHPCSCDYKQTKWRVPGKFVRYQEKLTLPVKMSDTHCIFYLLSQNEKEEEPSLISYAEFTLDEIVYDCDLTEKRKCQFSRALAPVSTKIAKRNEEIAKRQGFDDSIAHGYISVNFRLSTPQNNNNNNNHNNHDGHGTSDDESNEADTTNDSVQLRRSAVSYTADNFPSYHHLEHGARVMGQVCFICNKKIWLGKGLRCAVCSIVCHQKCSAECYRRPCEHDTAKQSDKSDDEEPNATKGIGSVTPSNRSFAYRDAVEMLNDENALMEASLLRNNIPLDSTADVQKLKEKVDYASKALLIERKNFEMSGMNRSADADRSFQHSASFSRRVTENNDAKVKSLILFYLHTVFELDELSPVERIAGETLSQVIDRVVDDVASWIKQKYGDTAGLKHSETLLSSRASSCSVQSVKSNTSNNNTCGSDENPQPPTYQQRYSSLMGRVWGAAMTTGMSMRARRGHRRALQGPCKSNPNEEEDDRADK